MAYALYFGTYHPSRTVQRQSFVAGYEKCICIFTFAFLSPFMAYPERPPGWCSPLRQKAARASNTVALVQGAVEGVPK